MKTPEQQLNITVNEREFSARRTDLVSTPRYITLGAHYSCNANCVFCLGGDYPAFSPEVYRTFFEPKLQSVLSTAQFVGFCGWGEILLMPGIEGFLKDITASLPYAGKVFTTNGIALTQGLSDTLLELSRAHEPDVAPFSVLVSLHASNAELHHKLTRTKAFERIKEQIAYITKRKKEKAGWVHINLVFLATAANVHDLPDFVRMASQLGADEVSCNYLTMFDPKHLEQTCYFQREKTTEMFESARALAGELGIRLSLPPLFGNNDSAPQVCHDPWEFLYVETQGSVNPCCFAGNHIGYLNKSEFADIWNGPGYKDLRTGFVTGPVHSWCKYCYRYKPSNVDDIRSHITFRPDTQKALLQYLKDHRKEFPVADEMLEL